MTAMADKKRKDDYLTVAAEYLAGLEAEKPAYLPPRSEGARAALDRWNALPGDQKQERLAEGEELGRIWEYGQGESPVDAPPGRTPFFLGDKVEHPAQPGQDFSLPGTAPLGARVPAGAEAPPTRAQDWKDASMTGASMKPGAKKAARPGVDVSMAGEADAGSMWERLQAGGRAPYRPEAVAKVAAVSPLVAEALQPRDELAEARDAERGSKLGARLARAGAMVNEGLTRARYERGAYDDLERDAEQPVNDLALRRRMSQEDAATKLAQARGDREAADSARTQALYDPGSERSRTARAQLLLRFPKEAGAIPQEQLARMSAADVAEYLQGFNLDRTDDRQRERDRLEAAWRSQDRQDRNLDRQESREFRRFQMGEATRAREDAQAEKARLQHEARYDKGLQRLGEQTTKAPYGEMQTALESIDAQAPGIAYGQAPAENPMSFKDRVARKVPFGAGEWAMSDEGKKYAATVTNLRDLISRMRSGAVLNAGEEAHYSSLIGDDVLSDPTKAAAGINAVRQGIAQKLRNAQVPYSRTGVLDEFEQGGGTSYRAPIFSGTASPSPTPTGIYKRLKDGRLVEKMSDGSAREVSGG